MADIIYLRAICNEYQHDIVSFSNSEAARDNRKIQPLTVYQFDDPTPRIPWGEELPFGHRTPKDNHMKIELGSQTWYIWQKDNDIRVGDSLNSADCPPIEGASQKEGEKVLIVFEDGLRLENWQNDWMSPHTMKSGFRHYKIKAITNESDTKFTGTTLSLQGNESQVTLDPWEAKIFSFPQIVSVPEDYSCYGDVTVKVDDPYPTDKGFIFRNNKVVRLYNWDVAQIVQRSKIEPINLQDNEIVVYETEKDSRIPFRRSTRFQFEREPNRSYWQSITIDPDRTYQEIVGFGGAFSDAAALNLLGATDEMPDEAKKYKGMSSQSQDEILSAYFGTNGIGYSVGRVPMGSTDFSVENYSYAPEENDVELEHFQLSPYDTQKIKFIHEANKKRGNNLTLFSSVWTAPPWMKTPKKSEGNPWVGGELKPEFYWTWALYFSKFFDAYKQHGLNFWGCTVQNEPAGAKPIVEIGGSEIIPAPVYWESMQLPPETESYFVGNYLGPRLDENHPEIKIMCYEDQKNNMPDDPMKILTHDSQAAQYIDGIAFHWYQKSLRIHWCNGSPWCPDVLNETHQQMGSDRKFLFATEACQGYEAFIGGSGRGPTNDYNKKWVRGEEYGHDIIADLNNWTVGWTDWNLVLDMNGGPNWAGNLCDALILCDAERDSYYIQPMFYYFAHFTKFIPPGSLKIGVDSKVEPGHLAASPMECTALKTRHGHIIVVVMNAGTIEQSHNYWIHVKERGYINVEGMKANSIQTFIIQ